MSLIRRFISALILLIRILTIDVWQILFRILLWLFNAFRRVFGKAPSEFDRKKRLRQIDCVPMSHPAFKVPDPLIYSQQYLMGLGLAVTWDNPDIVLMKDGVYVPSAELQTDTEYDIIARIWNNSLDAPVVDLPIAFSYLAFGIGTQSFPITDPQKPVLVTLGVKGGPNHPAFAVTKWRTPSVEGHYCIQVRLDPESDANYGNNLGQENTQVGTAQSPAGFAFVIRNNSPNRATIRFETDTYTLLSAPPPCGPSGTAAFDPRKNVTALYPVPPGWTVDINPPNPELAPNQQLTIAVMITPPQGFVGTKAFNVNAFDNGSFLGGVTLYVNAK